MLYNSTITYKTVISMKSQQGFWKVQSGCCSISGSSVYPHLGPPGPHLAPPGPPPYPHPAPGPPGQPNPPGPT